MRTSVIKFAYYFLRAKSKITLIKGFDCGTSLHLPADICFLLLKVWPLSNNLTKKTQTSFLKTDEALVSDWYRVYASL